MAGKSREELWENERCIDCGGEIEEGMRRAKVKPVRCEKHAWEHKKKQAERRLRKKNAKLCRIPRCRRKRVGRLTTCFECAFGKRKDEVEDWVELAEKKFKSFLQLSRTPKGRASH